ncbi:adenylate/guanylate cyclase domain-containing protein [Desulfococcaceae bacterium HSG8]|nr:adenylate/guanylate cyclase domain-containing protein [Desulfococcaceae bacterium HSG8]
MPIPSELKPMIENNNSNDRLRSIIYRYMDPDVAEQLMDGGEDVLGGRSTEATILFSGIRSFTSLTEKLGARGTVSFLNDYFPIMVECIHNNGGMLDKFIGDGIMAAFGVPMPHDDDEDRGVQAAIAMLSEMFKWNYERKARGEAPVDMGAGLSTGAIFTGNIGSPKQMNYTMIGDDVNLACRLERVCKHYAARILISEFTYRKLRGMYRTREIDQVIKGKTEAVRIYEVLDYHTEDSFPNMGSVLNIFREGVTEYRKQKWDTAIKAFNEALRLNPADRLCSIYIGWCNDYKEVPPRKIGRRQDSESQVVI